MSATPAPRRSRAWWVLALGFALAGPGGACLAIAQSLHASLFDCLPLWNDEVEYWNEIACFAHAGFGGGYFVADGRPAPASWCHFGPHGPGFAVVYGTGARVFGWDLAYGPRFNVAVLLLGGLAWVWLCRPDAKRLAVGTLLLATFWPSVYYAPTTMQESLHCAVALVLSGLFHRSLTRHGNPKLLLAQILLTVAVASLIRITWCLVLIPFAFTAFPGMSRLRRAGLFVAVVCVALGLAYAWQQLSAPYPGFLSELARASAQSPRQGTDLLREHVAKTASQFFEFRQTTADWLKSLEILQRQTILAVLAVALWSVVPAGLLFRRRPGSTAATPGSPESPAAEGAMVAPGPNVWSRQLTREDVVGLARRFLADDPASSGARPATYAFAAINLLLICGVALTAYKPEARILAPHLLLSLLLMLSGAGWRWVLGSSVVQVWYVPTLLYLIGATHHDRVTVDVRAVAEVRGAIERHFPFDPTRDGWGNTLLVDKYALKPPLLAVQPGIGLSLMVQPDGIEHLKAAYVILPPAVVRARPDFHLRQVGETPIGPLYRNLDCPSPGAGDP